MTETLSPPTPEKENLRQVTPVVSHIAFGAVETGYFDPEKKNPNPDHIDALKTATPDKLSHNALNTVCIDSRKKHYEGDGKSFDERNKIWSEAFWQGVTRAVDKDSVDPKIRNERLKAYQALGIDIANGEKKGTLYKQAEAFRIKYAKKNDTEQFFRDIIEGCNHPDGSVNLIQIKTRLAAVEFLLPVFGKENGANLLVKDFMIARAMLSQTGNAKEQVVNEVKQQMSKPLTDSEKSRLAALWQKQQEINKTVTKPKIETKPEPPPPPPIERPQRKEVLPIPLTQELARTNPEQFKSLLLQKLGEKHPLASHAWEYLQREGRTSLDEVTLNPANWVSYTHRGKISLGTGNLPPAFKEKTHFDHEAFQSYEDEILYRFSHEMSHNFVFKIHNADPPILAQLNYQLIQMRSQPENHGLSALGSIDHYKLKGPDTQSVEDLTELVNMYLWDPAYFKRYTNFLADPRYEAERQRLGLTTLDQQTKTILYNSIEQTIQQHLQPQNKNTHTNDTTVTETTSPPEPTQNQSEKVVLTDPKDVKDQIKETLQKSTKNEVTIATTPDVLLPFIQQEIAKQAVIVVPLTAAIQEKQNGSGKQMLLAGAVKRATVTVTFALLLENTDKGLKVVRRHNDIKAAGLGSSVAIKKTEKAMTDIDTLLKQQINKAIGDSGKVEQVQIGDGVLECQFRKA